MQMCWAMLSCFSHVRLFATLWTVACQAPLYLGFSRQEYWSGLLCPLAVGLQGLNPQSLMSPTLQVDSFPLVPPGNPMQEQLINYMPSFHTMDFPSGSVVKNLPAMQETLQEDPLEKEMATHCSILAWEIPWTGEPGRLQSTGSQKRTQLSD